MVHIPGWDNTLNNSCFLNQLPLSGESLSMAGATLTSSCSGWTSGLSSGLIDLVSCGEHAPREGHLEQDGMFHRICFKGEESLP